MKAPVGSSRATMASATTPAIGTAPADGSSTITTPTVTMTATPTATGARVRFKRMLMVAPRELGRVPRPARRRPRRHFFAARHNAPTVNTRMKTALVLRPHESVLCLGRSLESHPRKRRPGGRRADVDVRPTGGRRLSLLWVTRRAMADSVESRGRGADQEVGRRPGGLPHRRTATFIAYGWPEGPWRTPLKVRRGADQEVGRRPGGLPHRRTASFIAFGGPWGHRDSLTVAATFIAMGGPKGHGGLR